MIIEKPKFSLNLDPNFSLKIDPKVMFWLLLKAAFFEFAFSLLPYRQIGT